MGACVRAYVFMGIRARACLSVSVSLCVRVKCFAVKYHRRFDWNEVVPGERVYD